MVRVEREGSAGYAAQISSMAIGKAKAAGEIGERWLENLDSIIGELEERWKVRVRSVMHGGSHAFVGAVEGEYGEQYVLKVEIPDTTEDEFMNGVRALRLADGRGYGRIFEVDVEKRACLLEQLGDTLKSKKYSVNRQIRIVCGLLAESWKIPCENAKLPDGADSIAWFRSFINETWKALEQPCSERVIAQAMAFLDSREKNINPAGYVLVHGDAHNNNTLQLPGTDEYKLIDPDGIVYEKEYDLGVLMREWPEEYRTEPLRKGRERCELISRLTGADAAGIWEWGFLQTVSTAMILLQIGEEELGGQMLKTAEAWCE